jgi:hypothetical protein
MDLFEKVIAGANAVYKELGTGYSESVYHRAMEVECRRNGIRYVYLFLMFCFNS